MCRPISFSLQLENGTTLYSDLKFGEDHSELIASLLKKYDTLAFLIKEKQAETLISYKKGNFQKYTSIQKACAFMLLTNRESKSFFN
jgi:hypothetical protein